MHTNDTNAKDEDLYYAACYISKKHQEIIFATVWLEFVDQLCEHEPVIVMPLNATPDVLGLTAKTILALSNKNAAKKSPLLPTQFANIPQAKVFHKKTEYPNIPQKQRHWGSTYYDMPGYQASIAKTIEEFDKYYLNFGIHATNNQIAVYSIFNAWNPIRISQKLSLSSDNDVLGALFLNYAKHCL